MYWMVFSFALLWVRPIEFELADKRAQFHRLEFRERCPPLAEYFLFLALSLIRPQGFRSSPGAN